MMYHERSWLQHTARSLSKALPTPDNAQLKLGGKNATNKYKEITSRKAGKIDNSKSEIPYFKLAQLLGKTA